MPIGKGYFPLLQFFQIQLDCQMFRQAQMVLSLLAAVCSHTKKPRNFGTHSGSLSGRTPQGRRLKISP